jgi:hypothetical protein
MLAAPGIRDVGFMKNAKQPLTEPEPINAEEFMRAVVSGTPGIMRQVGGIVNVDVAISIDEGGRIESFDAITCKSIVGRAVNPDDPEIVEAARTAVGVLRFRPARREGVAVRRSGFQLSFGFTTAALDCVTEDRVSRGVLN